MKRKMTILALIALLACATFLLTACGGKGLEGATWKYTYDLGSYTTYSFSNGTCTIHEVNTITGQQSTEKASYRISGNQLTLSLDGQEDTLTWNISGKTLTLSQNGASVTLDRQ